MLTKKTGLIIGDLITLAIFTIIGFATHGEAEVTSFLRMGTTFLPLVIGWFLIAPWFGLFDEQVTTDPKLLWRILPAMTFTAPLAAILRSTMLHSAALPIFVLVLGGSNALAMLLWRTIYFFINTQNNK